MKTTLTLATSALVITACAAMAQETLTVYAYDSFTPDWGPGPAIIARFVETCDCSVDLVAAGDGAAMLSRLQLEGAGTPADVVIGLDNFLMERARATGLFAPHGVEAALDLPVDWTDNTFMPFDWGPFGFIGTTDLAAPASLRELADSDLTVVIQDPRSSTPGLGLALWVKAAYGDEAEALWADLADNILTVTPGWSEAWALFLEGEAEAVLSYTTSPAYNVVMEDDHTKVAWPFSEGHLVQIEVAAVTATTDQPDLARAFIAHVVSAQAQAVIPETNWMFPAVAPETPLHPAFDAAQPASVLDLSPLEAAEIRDAAVADWQAGLSQ